MAPTHMTAAEPMQPLHRMEALQPMQAPTHMSVAEPMQPLQRMEAVQAPMAPTAMHEPIARTASDSTMVSGVSMTSGTPVHQAVQPIQAHDMYNTADPTPASPVQAVAAFETMAPTQMSHTFEAPEPVREGYNPLQAYSVADPVQGGYNPLIEGGPAQQAAGYDTLAQSGGAPVQPLRPTAANERPTRPVE